MDTFDAMSLNESQIHLLFEEANLMEIPEPDMQRVEVIVERALHEKAIKDTTSFVFMGFPAVMLGFMSVASNTVGDPQSDYRA